MGRKPVATGERARRTLRRGAVVFTGATLLLGSLAVEALQYGPRMIETVEVALFVLISGGVMTLGAVAARDDPTGETPPRVLPWTLGGAALVSLLAWTIVAVQQAAGVDLMTPVATALIGTNVGALVGTLLGVFSERLRRSQASLRERNERLNALTRQVSHDLRGPLTVARGYVDIVRETGDVSYLERVDDAHDRIELLTREVLTLAAVDPAGVREPVALADNAAVVWAGAGGDTGHLRVEGEPLVEADPRQLESLLENLFRNALEHVGTDVIVEVGALRDGFYVEDDGPGIPPSERERVLEAGYTSRENGTGFGLNIVERIAEVHGWSLAIRDGSERGTRFEFRRDGTP